MIKVYVVEDNNYLLEDIVHSLKFQGYDCYGVLDALAFNELLAKEVPDLIILDWNLPGEDGLSIAERLQLLKGLNRKICTLQTYLPRAILLLEKLREDESETIKRSLG